MTSVTETVEVRVPVRTAYNQWTQFEEFPQFMDGVEEVRQISDTRTHWKTKIAGVEREFDAEITQQVPDSRVAWVASGVTHAGEITFEPVGPDTTRVTAKMDIEPEGAVEQIGDKLGMIDRKVKADMERFKQFIESRGTETGAWRGEVGTGGGVTGGMSGGMSGGMPGAGGVAGQPGASGNAAHQPGQPGFGQNY